MRQTCASSCHSRPNNVTHNLRLLDDGSDSVEMGRSCPSSFLSSNSISLGAVPSCANSCGSCDCNRLTHNCTCANWFELCSSFSFNPSPFVAISTSPSPCSFIMPPPPMPSSLAPTKFLPASPPSSFLTSVSTFASTFPCRMDTSRR